MDESLNSKANRLAANIVGAICGWTKVLHFQQRRRLIAIAGKAMLKRRGRRGAVGGGQTMEGSGEGGRVGSGGEGRGGGRQEEVDVGKTVKSKGEEGFEGKIRQ